MSEPKNTVELSRELIELIGTGNQEQVKTDEKAKLLELQKAATATQKEAKYSELKEVTWQAKDTSPYVMAQLYCQMPWGPSGSYLPFPQALMLARYEYKTGLDPSVGEIFVLPSGKIGTALQGLKMQIENKGTKLSVPRFTEVKRPWRKGLKLVRKVNRQDVEFIFDEDPGVTCEMEINEQTMSYTAWLTEWFMGANPNWFDRMDHMLRVRSHMNCLKFGTGVGVSEDIGDTPDLKVIDVKAEKPVAPEKVPFTK